MQVNIALVIMLVILLSASTLAFGVTPARKILEYDEGLKAEYQVKVINKEGGDFKVSAYAEGPLAEYISFDKQIVDILDEQLEVPITVSVNIPDGVDLVGMQKSNVVLAQMPIGVDSSKTVSTFLAAASEVQVNFPYPGRYFDARVYISESQVGEPVHITIAGINLGMRDITSLSANIQILGPTNEVLADLKTNSVSVPSGQEGRLDIHWHDAQHAGIYMAKITIEYDGKEKIIEKIFDVGNIFILIRDMVVERFKLGEIAKLEFFLESKWNKRIQNVFGDVSIFDKYGNKVTRFRTSSAYLDPMAKEILPGFWDTTGVNVGEYDINIDLLYEGKKTSKLFETVVSVDSIRKKEDILTGNVVYKTRDGVKIDPIIMLVIGLIAINIVFFFYVRTRLGPGKPPQQQYPPQQYTQQQWQQQYGQQMPPPQYQQQNPPQQTPPQYQQQQAQQNQQQPQNYQQQYPPQQ